MGKSVTINGPGSDNLTVNGNHASRVFSISSGKTVTIFGVAIKNGGIANEAVYSGSADTGSNFRIDGCQYIYNLSASALGAITYQLDIQINGQVVGSGIFQLG